MLNTCSQIAMVNLRMNPDPTFVRGDKGMQVADFVFTLRKQGKKLSLVPHDGTAREFAASHKTGQYTVCVSGHVTVCSDGILLNQNGYGNEKTILVMRVE